MVRCVTLEIRWHETQPIYGASFQAVGVAQLRRILDHNAAQAAGLEAGKLLPNAASAADGEGSATASCSKSGSAVPAPSKSSSSHSAVLPIPAAGPSWRFATGGADNCARIWQLHPNIPSPAALAAAAASGSGPVSAPARPPRVEYMATLKRHTGTVNCVRFCPRGEMLATAGDDGAVILWVPDTSGLHPSSIDDDGDSEYAKEQWRTRSLIKVSQSEIYDMAWAHNGENLIVGGTDFVARIINASDGTVLREIAEHSHYVQGVAWDPLHEYVATQSSDRSVHLHALHKPSDSATGVHPLSVSHAVSRNSRMDVHRRSSSNSAGAFVWDSSAKPPMKRRASSHASQAEDAAAREGKELVRTLERRRSGRSVTPLDPPLPATSPNTGQPPSTSAAAAPTGATAAARDGTPAPPASVPQSPAVSAASAQPMHPPQRTPSRRSSFSSQAEALSPPTSTTSLAPSNVAPPAPAAASASGNGKPISGLSSSSSHTAHDPGSSFRRSSSRSRGLRPGTPRSPSPAPPLPAIRAPPSPRQRMAGLGAAGQGQLLLRSGMRMYGDESFSGFFRRLAFSPDGALLATPSGIFDLPPMAATPASPTVGVGNASMSGGGGSGGRSRRAASVAASEGSDLDHHRISPTTQHATASTAVGPATVAAGGLPLPNPMLSGPARSTVYLYGRGNFHRSNAPIAHLPGHKTATLAVRFNPILFELREGRGGGIGLADADVGGIPPHPTVPLEAGKQKVVALESAASKAGGVASSSAVEDETAAATATVTARPPPPPSMIGLPYRMVFAVATNESVFVYDTQQGGPLCCFSNMHYSSFTDLDWSPDGQNLLIASSDGYCSIAAFDYEELGRPYSYAMQPSLAPLYANEAAGAASHNRPGATASTAGAAAAAGAAVAATTTTTTHATEASRAAAGSAPGATAAEAAAATTSQVEGTTPTATAGAATAEKAAGETAPDPTAAGAGSGAGSGAPERKRRRIAPTLLS